MSVGITHGKGEGIANGRAVSGQESQPVLFWMRKMGRDFMEIYIPAGKPVFVSRGGQRCVITFDAGCCEPDGLEKMPSFNSVDFFIII